MDFGWDIIVGLCNVTFMMITKRYGWAKQKVMSHEVADMAVFVPMADFRFLLTLTSLVCLKTLNYGPSTLPICIFSQRELQ
jgi:hypothetical protein